MTEHTSPLLRELPVRTDPPTDEHPLVVRDHPYADNLPAVGLAVLVILGPVVAVIVRAAAGSSPVVDGLTATALWTGPPLGGLILWFLHRLSPGTEVALGGRSIRRTRRRPRDEVQRALAELRGVLLASHVRYGGKRHGSELVLFMADGAALWIAGGIRDRDIRRLAEALSAYGVRELTEPTTSPALLALVKLLRDGDPPATGARPTGAT